MKIYYPVYVIDKEVSDAKDGWCERGGDDSKVYLRKELLKLWKDQRVQTIYFN